MKEPTVVEVINFMKQALVDRAVLELTQGRARKDLVPYTDSQLDAFLVEHNDALDDTAVDSIIGIVNAEPDLEKNDPLKIIIGCCKKKDRDSVYLNLIVNELIFSLISKEVFYQN